MKKSKLPLFIGISIVILFILLGVLINLDNSEDIENKTIDKWVQETKEGTVVTVVGLTTCSHCQAYKPNIISLAKKEGFNLYFFELDTLSEEDRKIVLETYNIEYGESVPYTFIIDKGVYVAGKTGYGNMTGIKSFLKENGILEN